MKGRRKKISVLHGILTVTQFPAATQEVPTGPGPTPKEGTEDRPQVLNQGEVRGTLS